MMTMMMKITTMTMHNDNIICKVSTTNNNTTATATNIIITTTTTNITATTTDITTANITPANITTIKYRPGHPTEMALTLVTNVILSALDLLAAFETVGHSVLLKRLASHIGLGGTALRWVESYVKGQTQYISISDAKLPPLTP